MQRRDFIKIAALATLTGCGTKTPAAANRIKKSRPNILFCISDDVSYPHMGAYGCDWIKTPGFDRVAKNGILFNNAYTPNAKCAPSRCCVITGRNSWQLEEAGNHWPFFPAKFKTYPETLTENGYHVGFTGKGIQPVRIRKVNGKIRQLSGKPYQKKRTPPPATGISSCDYAANFEQFLNDKPAGKPFCFWYGGLEAHRKYEFKAGITKGGKKLSDIDKVPKFWPDTENVRTDMLDYAYEIEHFEMHLQRILDKLEEFGELDNTLVVVTSDNGMPFPRCKGQEYEYSNHLPMAAMWKNGINKPGRTVDDFVSFIDFAPTFLDLAKIDQATCGMQKIQGKTLSKIFNSSKSKTVDPSRDHVLIGKERHDVGRPGDVGYPIRGIVKGNLLYVHNFETSRWPAGNPETGYLNSDGGPTKTNCLQSRKKPSMKKYWEMSFAKRRQEELYDIKSDPECITNLAEKPEYISKKKKLKTQLFAELKQQKDPRMFGKGDIFDKYEYSNTVNKNFYERYMKGEDIKARWVEKTDFEKVP